MELATKKCIPCEGGIPPLSLQKINELMPKIEGWELQGDKISKNFQFENFKEAIRFVNKVAELAEQENHHPNILINYNIVIITLWTHAVNGLSENDFILAAKIDKL